MHFLVQRFVQLDDPKPQGRCLGECHSQCPTSWLVHGCPVQPFCARHAVLLCRSEASGLGCVTAPIGPVSRSLETCGLLCSCSLTQPCYERRTALVWYSGHCCATDLSNSLDDCQKAALWLCTRCSRRWLTTGRHRPALIWRGGVILCWITPCHCT